MHHAPVMDAAEALGISYADYLALEAASDQRYQYVEGVAYAMAGGDPEHAGIAANIIAALVNLLRGRPCRVFTSDLKVRVPSSGNAYYADVTVVCGRLERHPDDPLAVTNPSLLVEVLSPTTATFDRGDKFADYQKFRSLRHYLLVSTASARIEHYRRNDDGSWTYVLLTPGLPGAVVALPDLGGNLSVEDVYAGRDEG